MRPSSICKLTDGMIACASDMTSEVYTITVSSNGHVLCGSVTPLPSYPERCNHIQSMCLGSQNYLFLANTKGFWQFSMSQKTVERIVVLQSDPPPIVCIHSISALQDGSIAFKDQDSRQLKLLQRGGGGCSESNRWDQGGEQQKWLWKSFRVWPRNGRLHQRS